MEAIDTDTDTTFGQELISMREALRRRALRLVHEDGRADDLVQDVMSSAWAHRHTYRSGASMRPWLFTILRNAFINGYHRQRTAYAALAEFACPAADGYRQPLCIESPMPGPEEAIGAIEAVERLTAALRPVSPEYRGVLDLVIAGRSHKEIAEELECRAGTVMSRASRGRDQIRQALVGQGLIAALRERGVVSVDGDLAPEIGRLSGRMAGDDLVDAVVSLLWREDSVEIFVEDGPLRDAVALALHEVGPRSLDGLAALGTPPTPAPQAHRRGHPHARGSTVGWMPNCER